MAQSHSIPLVGAHFRPPAKALIQSLPVGQVLRLSREPDNQYDTNAIQVWLRHCPPLAKPQPLSPARPTSPALAGNWTKS